MPIPTRPEIVRSNRSTPNEASALPSSAPTSLRVAIVVERYVPTGGGVEGVASQVADALHRLGVDVTVLTRSADPRLVKDTRSGPKVQLIRVPSFWQPLRVAAFSRATAYATSHRPFDVVHSFSRTRHQDLYRAGGGRHRDYLRHNYAADSPTLRRLRPLSPRHHTLLRIEEAVFRDPSQRIQCASKLVADALIGEQDVAPERILLLPNAVDATRFGTDEALSGGRRLRSEIDEKAERIWLFPASGWKRKGLSTLLEAFSKVRDPGLRLWIAGRDEPATWRKIAANLGISERIRFLGQRDDLETVYGAVDAMVLPTRYDAFANVTLEAAASGLPIITTETNGASEWLDGALVVLDDAWNADALAEAMRALSDRDERRRLGARAQAVARKMDWPTHAAALCESYHQIVERRAKIREDPRRRPHVPR